MKRTAKILKTLFLLNAREPISFYYNLAVPLVAFIGILFWQSKESQYLFGVVDILYSLSAYTIYSSGAYGVGIMFAFWREQGLFLSFCKNRSAVFHLLIGQVVLRSLATSLYVLIFLFFAFIYFKEWMPHLLFSLPLLAFFLSLLAGLFSLALLILPFSPRDLNAIVGASVFVFLFLNALTFHGTTHNLLTFSLNLINPIYFNARLLDFLNGSAIDRSTAIGLLLSAAFFVLLGAIGLLKFRPHPVISRL